MNVSIRILEPEDVTIQYVEWFSDPEVTQHSENRFMKFTLESQKQYVRDMLESDHRYLYGIFDDQGLHIGNVTIGPIDFNHMNAEISYIVGERTMWGKGIATYAVREIANKAFGEFGLHKIYAGVYSTNLGSIKVLERAEFTLEGVRKDHFISAGTRADLLEYGRIREHD
jgi:RimJ/RimL family protein N-acetyltransferase